MSLLYGKRFPTGVLVVSDCRITSYSQLDGRVTGQMDAGVKLAAGPIGLLAYNGYTTLGLHIIERMCVDPPTDGESLLARIREAQQHVDADSSLSDIVRGLTTPVTGWAFTQEIEGRVHAWHYHPKRGHQLQHVPQGSTFCLVPIDPSDARPIDDWFEEQLEAAPRSTWSDAEATVALVVPLLRGVCLRFSALSTSVSPCCQVGLHMAGARWGVTPILQPDTEWPQARL